MVRNNKRTKIILAMMALTVVMVFSLSSCVDQSGGKKESAKSDKARLVATSFATTQICDKLNLDLVGVGKTSHNLAKQYKKLPTVGMVMNPDMEKIKHLKPDYILSPVTLKSDLEPKYKAAKLKYIFLNLNSVEGMYGSITELGKKFGHEKEAKALNDDFNRFMEEYNKKNAGKKKPKVLVLMGFPGSYIVATEKSYVGSLVKLAGGENVFPVTGEDEFLTANTEEIKRTEPDVIVRTTHADNKAARKMFAKEFKTNQNWKHLKAVKNNRVYDLNPDYFGMSANFDYPKALEDLQPMLYGK